MKKILFKINDEGEVSMEVQGAIGASCDELSAPFEVELGVISTKERKIEYYQSEEMATDLVGESHE